MLARLCLDNVASFSMRMIQHIIPLKVDMDEMQVVDPDKGPVGPLHAQNKV